jgi:hypothetical protein
MEKEIQTPQLPQNAVSNCAIAWWNKVNWEERHKLTEKYIFRVVNYQRGRYCDPLRVDEIEKIYKLEHSC